MTTIQDIVDNFLNPKYIKTKAPWQRHNCQSHAKHKLQIEGYFGFIVTMVIIS
jgi:hypothetical protein